MPTFSFNVAGVVAVALACLTLPADAQSSRLEKISVDDARPIRTAIDKLEAMYGWAITYEDPPYEHAKDLIDLSDPVFLREHPGLRRLFPRGGHFEFGFDVPSSSSPESKPVLDALLRAYKSSGNPGIFALGNTGSTWHIEPAGVVRKDGRTEPVRSVLDQLITFPKARRTSLETFQLILSALNASGKAVIVPAVIALNALNQTTSTEGPEAEPAKAVLVRVFEDVNRRSIELIGEPRRIVWDINYEPDSKTYYFNMHGVTIEEKIPSGGTRRRPI